MTIENENKILISRKTIFNKNFKNKSFFFHNVTNPTSYLLVIVIIYIILPIIRSTVQYHMLICKNIKYIENYY